MKGGPEGPGELKEWPEQETPKTLNENKQPNKKTFFGGLPPHSSPQIEFFMVFLFVFRRLGQQPKEHRTTTKTTIFWGLPAPPHSPHFLYIYMCVF